MTAPRVKKEEECRWTKREGEKGVSYKRHSGAGGSYGEIQRYLSLKILLICSYENGPCRGKLGEAHR